MTDYMSRAACRYFTDLSADAAEWGGATLIGANVHQGPEQDAFLTDLKRRRLVTTEFDDAGNLWAHFTEEGEELARMLGHPVCG